MSVDNYLNRLRKAGWDWLEHKNSWYHRAPRNKDRRSGRAEKRAARALDRKEIDSEKIP
jgi:hypothetical protein